MPQTFNPAVMTDGGAALLTKAQAGQCSIEFTRIVTGDGTYTASEETVEALEKRTALKSEKNSYAISSCEVYSEKTVKVTALISNVDPDTGESVVTTGYYINEVGLYGKEKGGSSSTEVLYSLAIVASTPGDYMPAYNGYDPAQITQDYYATVDNSANVTIDSSGAVVTVEEADKRQAELEDKIKANTDLIDSIAGDSAGAHNGIYRGKSLGSSVTTDQWNAIKAGTFDDLYIGDYWTINSVNYRIAGFDYYIRTGSSYNFSSHHVVVVPDTNLYTAQMNASNTTEGGYVGSLMFTENLEDAKATIKSAFGEAHIATHEEYLTNAITDGSPSGGAWTDVDVVTMNEEMVYGCPIRQQMGSGGISYTTHTVSKSQLPLFRLNPYYQCIRSTFWLRDIASASTFCYCSSAGNANYTGASGSNGVRPAFCIYQS